MYTPTPGPQSAAYTYSGRLTVSRYSSTEEGCMYLDRSLVSTRNMRHMARSPPNGSSAVEEESLPRDGSGCWYVMDATATRCAVRPVALPDAVSIPTAATLPSTTGS